jgi:hypothetical protein
VSAGQVCVSKDGTQKRIVINPNTPYARSKLEGRFLEVTQTQTQLARIVGHTLGELIAENEHLTSERQRLEAENTMLKHILTSNRWFATV